MAVDRVHIGPPFDKRCGRFVIRVEYGEIQKRRSFGSLRVDVRAGIEKRFDDVRASFPDGVHDGIVAAL